MTQLPLTTLIEVGVGATLAATFIVYARSRGRDGALRVFSFGLIIAALVYVVLATLRGGTDWLPVEILGVVVFSVVAAAGLRGQTWLLAGGWALHVAWDVWLHTGTDASFVPGWYPFLCVGFDLPVAAYLGLQGIRTHPASPAGTS